MRALALAALLALPLAGCLAPAADEVAPAALGLDAVDPWPAVRGLLADVPCEADAVGPSGTSANVKVLAEDALEMNAGPTHGELAVFRAADGRTVAAVARYNAGGVDLLDLADPLAPVQLASWDPEAADRALDVKPTADGTAVLVGGDTGITILDVRDLAEPKVESKLDFAKPQAHMLAVFRVAGDEYVAAPKGEGEDMPIYRIVGEPGARTLERVSSPTLTTLSARWPHDLLRSHDAWFEVDPKTGTPTLWIANVWFGVVALDVSDPASPKEIARIPNADPYQGYTHTVQVAHLDGRRLVVAVQEVGANALKVWDATDLAAPRLVALWHVPAVAKPQHNLQIVGERAYVAHYSEGVFVFDLRAVGGGPLPTLLEPVAHLDAAKPPSLSPTGGLGSLFGGTWDVVVRDGLLYTSEIEAGVRVVGYGCLWPGDEGASSTG